MSRILSTAKDTKTEEVKLSVENFLKEVSKAERELFSHQEVEDMLLDLYNLVTK